MWNLDKLQVFPAASLPPHSPHEQRDVSPARIKSVRIQIFGSRELMSFGFVLLLMTKPSVCFGRQDDQMATTLTVSQRREVVNTAWQEVHDLFYDPDFRGVDWNRVHQQYLSRIDEVQTIEQTEALIREMVGRLHNSHSGVMTHDEVIQSHNVLPFFFDKADHRVFVSYVFETREGAQASPLRFGDEILAVDSQPAKALRFPDSTWLVPILSNPYYGPAGSVAKVTIRRRGIVLTLQVPRLKAFSDIQPLVVRNFGSVGYLRFLKMDNETVPPDMLRAALQRAAKSDALVLDLRHCEGGDAPVSDLLGGMLLGPDVELVRHVPRPTPANDKSIVEKTTDFGSIYKGRVVLLVDRETYSQPEMLAAALNDYGRVKIIGEQTRGALNGFTEGVPLPDHVGILVIPVNRGISPHGKEYEGHGVPPDVKLQNSTLNFNDGQDIVLQTAVKIASQAWASTR